jgi:XTP/dITP diphosphohydrolase
MKKIFLGTNNQGKLKEFADFFKKISLQIISPEDLGIDFDPPETGATFEANALQKAKAWAKKTNLPTLVDDSGLSVDTLGGKPGIYSARFAETDQSRNAKVLDLLKSSDNRKAHFTSVIGFCDLNKNLEKVFIGICDGQISHKLEKGNFGFGYDPIFIPSGYKQSFAQLGKQVKYKIGHRAQALAKTATFLQQWVNSY